MVSTARAAARELLWSIPVGQLGFASPLRGLASLLGRMQISTSAQFYTLARNHAPGTLLCGSEAASCRVIGTRTSPDLCSNVAPDATMLPCRTRWTGETASVARPAGASCSFCPRPPWQCCSSSALSGAARAHQCTICHGPMYLTGCVAGVPNTREAVWRRLYAAMCYLTANYPSHIAERRGTTARPASTAAAARDSHASPAATGHACPATPTSRRSAASGRWTTPPPPSAAGRYVTGLRGLDWASYLHRRSLFCGSHQNVRNPCSVNKYFRCHV